MLMIREWLALVTTFSLGLVLLSLHQSEKVSSFQQRSMTEELGWNVALLPTTATNTSLETIDPTRNASNHRHYDVEQSWQINPSISTTSTTTSSSSNNNNNRTISSTSSPVVSKPRLLVAGLARDCEAFADGLLESVLRLQTHFELVEVVLFENDSRDGTVSALHAWEHNSTPPIKVRLISKRNIYKRRIRKTSRTIVLAKVRNLLWESITASAFSDTIEHVLLMDMDDVNLELRGVHHCLSLPSPSVCCANQYHIYYDVWALRAKGWVDGNIQDIGLDKRKEAQRHISAREAPIGVDSCFGGAALYPYQVIRNSTLLSSNQPNQPNQPKQTVELYKGSDEKGDYSCEHVVFHSLLQQHIPQIRLWIQPKFLNQGPLNLLARKRFLQRFRSDLDQSWNDSSLDDFYGPVKGWLWKFY